MDIRPYAGDASPADTRGGDALAPAPPGIGTLLVQAQAMQMMHVEAWFAWQHGMFAAWRDLCDQWTARFGGGLPIDA